MKLGIKKFIKENKIELIVSSIIVFMGGLLIHAIQNDKPNFSEFFVWSPSLFAMVFLFSYSLNIFLRDENE